MIASEIMLPPRRFLVSYFHFLDAAFYGQAASLCLYRLLLPEPCFDMRDKFPNNATHVYAYAPRTHYLP